MEPLFAEADALRKERAGRPVHHAEMQHRLQCNGSLSKARRQGLIAIGSRSSSNQYELAPSQTHRPNLGTALQQKVIHHHE